MLGAIFLPCPGALAHTARIFNGLRQHCPFTAREFRLSQEFEVLCCVSLLIAHYFCTRGRETSQVVHLPGGTWEDPTHRQLAAG